MKKMEIPIRAWQRWDGSSKSYTKDCCNCEWYREIDGKELCGWGIAFKYLVRSKKQRICDVKKRDLGQFETHSVEYLDELVRKN